MSSVDNWQHYSDIALRVFSYIAISCVGVLILACLAVIVYIRIFRKDASMALLVYYIQILVIV